MHITLSYVYYIGILAFGNFCHFFRCYYLKILMYKLLDTMIYKTNRHNSTHPRKSMEKRKKRGIDVLASFTEKSKQVSQLLS